MFAIEKIDQIEGQINFYKLTVNGECLLDLFIDACEKEGGLDSEIIQIQSRMQSFADMKLMPKTKLNPITPKKENYKEYEIKTKHLRVYFLHDKINGFVVVTGGKKTSQKKDIQQFRSIKNRYLKQLNDEK